MLFKSVSLDKKKKKLLYVFFGKIKKVFSNFLKNALETLKKKNTLSVFSRSTWEIFIFIFVKKKALLKFLDIPKIPIYLSLNIYLFYFKFLNNMIYF